MSDVRRTKQSVDTQTTEALIALGQLSLQFGLVNRATYHADGVTSESDTDHSVMLALLACSFAERFLPKLDIGKVAQYSLIHDIVEVYAGDTPTLTISTAERKAKESREAKAIVKIHKRFKIMPWLPTTIDEYQTLTSPEARFVKTMDKLMPKITHLLNNSTLLKEKGFKATDLEAHFGQQKKTMAKSYGQDQPEVLALHDILSKLIQERY